MKKYTKLVLLCSLILVFVICFNIIYYNTKPANNLLKLQSNATTSEWLDTVEEPNNYDYSFAIVGDTQTISYKCYIAENVESK